MDAKIGQLVIRICKSKITVIAAGLIVIYAVTGFFLFPSVIERLLPGMLSQRLKSEVSLQEVRINPFKLTLEAREFQINEPSGRSMAGFQRLYINFQLSSLFRWALTFADIIMDSPSVNVVIAPDGRLNLARLSGKDPAADTEETSAPMRMLIHNIVINEGKIDVTDTRQPVPVNVSFSHLNIQVANISTLPGREGFCTLTATSADGAHVEWSGQLSLRPFRSEGSLEFKQIPLTTPWKFFRSQMNISPPKGSLSLKTHYLIDLGKDATIVTSDDLNVMIKDIGLQVDGAEEGFLNLPEITLNVGKLDMVRRKIDNVRLAIRGGDLNLIKDRDGILNMQRLTGKGEDSTLLPSEPSGEQKEPWTVNISKVDLGDITLTYTDQSMEPTVAFSTDDIHMAFKATVTTDSPKTQVQVEDLGLTLQQTALGFADTPQPALQIGTLTMAGDFDFGARSASISRLEVTDGMVNVIKNSDNTVNLARLFNTKNSAPEAPIKNSQKEENEPWQYSAEVVSLSGFKTRFIDLSVNPHRSLIDLDKITLIMSRFDGKSSSPFEMGLRVIQGGELTAVGTFDPSGVQVESTITIKDLALPTVQPYISRMADLTMNSGLLSTRGTFHRAAGGGMKYRGQLGIADLQIIENSTRDTLLGWQQLQIPDVHLALNPNGLEIDSVNVTEPRGKLIISEDKTVNVVEAFKSKHKPPTTPQEEKAAPKVSKSSFPVRIGKLSLNKGILHFADFSLSPQFVTKIHELKGGVTGISSSLGVRAQVGLEGRVDEYGISKIQGEFNVFDPKRFTNIDMAFRNLEMTNLTPYSGKFAGRKIEEGKLSLDLQYKVNNSELVGDNKIVIDSLKLGEKVESPDAVNLPLELAVALLKDADGVIDIDLSVSGNLSDPEFSYGALIGKALVNLLTKIIASPFRVLGALFGGDEETLGIVNFEPGSSSIMPPEQEKLAKLLDALAQRPQLKLIVIGRYHNDSDGQAIKRLQVCRALAEIPGISLEPGADLGPVDFSNPDSRQRLTELFVDRYGQKAYETLRAETVSTDAAADSEEESKGSGELAKFLFSELVKREPVEPILLEQLADTRAQAIVRQMTGPDGMPSERVIIRPSKSTESGEPVSSILELEAIAPEIAE